jgi:hypothetical protein
MGYHQGVQKQNCLKCFFIRKRIGVPAGKLQGIGRERSLTIAAKNKTVLLFGSPIILIIVSPDPRKKCLDND